MIRATPADGKGRSRVPALAGMTAALLALAGCLFQGEKPSVPEGAGVRGVFVDSAGRPLQGARVLAMPVESFRLAKASRSTAQGSSDMVETDASGRYSFPDLASGDYNLLAEYGKGQLAALVPDVRYRDSAGLLELGLDTLEAPGAIQGRVLRNGKGYEGVVAYLPGTSFLAVSDSTGSFLAAGIPAGTYRVNYLVPGFRASRDTGVRVQPGRITRLMDKALANDTALPPPAPSAPFARLDTARGRIRLSWRPVDVDDILGYLVYRDTGGGSSPVLLNGRILTDTVFSDTLPVTFWRNGDTIEVSYRLRSIDKGKNISTSYSPPATVRAPPRSSQPTWMALRWLGTVGGVGGVFAAGDTVQAELEFYNPFQPYLEVAWKRSDDSSWTDRDTLRGLSGRIRKTFTLHSLGTNSVSVEAGEVDGVPIWAEASVQVIAGVPMAEAGNYPAVSVGDEMLLAGKDESQFGVVVKREWDIGGGGVFEATEDGRIRITAPRAEDTLLCIYRVTDDRGRQAEDSAGIVVIADPPTAVLSGPRQVFQGDSIRLSIDRLEDRFGGVVEWAWDIGDKGVFTRTARRDTSWLAGAADTLVVCVLQVTDDDGQTGRIEYRIRVRPRSEWIMVYQSEPISLVDNQYAWEYDGKLWISTSNPLIPRPGGNNLFGAMYSVDLVHWTFADFSASHMQGQPAPAPTPIRAEGGRIWGLRQGDDMGVRLFSSADGVKWDSVAIPAGLSDKELGVAEPFLGELFAMGGLDPRYGQQIWATRGGTVFYQASSKAAFGNRYLMLTAVLAGRMWLYGGMLNEQVSNDVWSSADGIAWVRESDSALAQPRHMASMVAHKDELWIAGGEAYPGGRLRDMWRSRNGRTWTRDSLQSPLLGGNDLRTAMVSFRGRLVLIAVHPDREGDVRMEVWMAP